MNRKRLLGSVVFWFAALPLGAQIYFSEGFENRVYPPDNTTLPPGWTQSYASGSVNWEFQMADIPSIRNTLTRGNPILHIAVRSTLCSRKRLSHSRLPS